MKIGKLSQARRLELIDELWESLDPADIPVPEWHKKVLDEALEAYERNPEEGSSWEDGRAEVFPKG